VRFCRRDAIRRTNTYSLRTKTQPPLVMKATELDGPDKDQEADGEQDGQHGEEEIVFKAIRRDLVRPNQEGIFPRSGRAGPTCRELVEAIVERIQQACKDAGADVRVEEKDIVRCVGSFPYVS
jgi:hypothetical protein